MDEGIAEVAGFISLGSLSSTKGGIGRDSLLGVSDDTPHAVLAQIGPFLTVHLELRIGHNLHGESSAEECDTDCPDDRLDIAVQRQRRGSQPEWHGEGQGNQGEESRLREILLEQSRGPEPIGVFLLQLVIARVILAAGDSPRSDASKKPSTPNRNTSQEHLFRPRESRPGSLRRDIMVVDLMSDGAPPGVDNLARRPAPVLDFGAVGSLGCDKGSDVESRVESEGGEDG